MGKEPRLGSQKGLTAYASAQETEVCGRQLSALGPLEAPPCISDDYEKVNRREAKEKSQPRTEVLAELCHFFFHDNEEDEEGEEMECSFLLSEEHGEKASLSNISHWSQ